MTEAAAPPFASPAPARRALLVAGLAGVADGNLLERLEDIRHGRERVDLLTEGLAQVEQEALAGALGLPLELRGGAGRARRLGSALLLFVQLDPVQVAEPRLGGPQVLHAHMDALDELFLPVHLVHLNTDGTARHVPHSAGAAVVELVRHALLLARVAHNIDGVANLVLPQEGGERRVAALVLGLF
eukprot:CAMPEP_0185473764 /NCGR_PEP_ID=MMETSP1366-20130426/1654_1 /TAXON_ID=38817 /ORGANISM="Gephyrocapsa oceanica, Strain RCC1303" /LENGTH=185 /DNA_ID=CAMNT_0028080645 /DNA_START=191 /DNA_END=749 /DNA_ORIENTATION=+